MSTEEHPTDVTPKPRMIWHRLDGEGDKAFYAFNVYVTLPMNGRSLEKARQKVINMGERPPSISQFKTWSTKYEWRRRVSAYDSAAMEELRNERNDAQKAIWERQFMAGTYMFTTMYDNMKRKWEQYQAELKDNPRAKDPFTERQKFDFMKYGSQLVSVAAAGLIIDSEADASELEQRRALEITLSDVAMSSPDRLMAAHLIVDGFEELSKQRRKDREGY